MELKDEMEKTPVWPATGDLTARPSADDSFASAMRATRMAMLITDPRRAGNPIVFANDAFLRLTGYERSEIAGENCRLLQGPDTDSATIQELRDAIAERRDINVDILNYRKDGSAFWNALFISPVYGDDDELQYFFSSQLDVTERKTAEFQVHADKARFERAVAERTRELEEALEAKTALLHEVDHRVKNNLQMISSLIAVQSRAIDDEDIRRSLRSMLERVEALSTVHRKLYQSDDVTTFDVADFTRDLVTDLTGASGRPITARFDMKPMNIPAAKAAPVALILNELVTNALKHGFPDGAEGEIRVSVSQADNRCLIEVADNGRGFEEKKPEQKQSGKSFGLRLIRSIGRQLDAELTWSDGAPGTRVLLTFPAEKIETRKETST